MQSQTLKLTDRTILEINHAKNIISFDSDEFLIETPYGNLKINGKNLSIGKMDTEKQELTIKGSIDNISYLSNKNNPNNKKESVFKKIFK